MNDEVRQTFMHHTYVTHITLASHLHLAIWKKGKSRIPSTSNVWIIAHVTTICSTMMMFESGKICATRVHGHMGAWGTVVSR